MLVGPASAQFAFGTIRRPSTLRTLLSPWIGSQTTFCRDIISRCDIQAEDPRTFEMQTRFCFLRG